MRSSQLFGVPPPLEAEALSSWLTRLTLSQGVELREVAQHLGIHLRRDPDRFLHGDALSHVRRLCGLPDSALAIADRAMQSLDLMRPWGDHYMARSGNSKARFRFCVICLSEMRTPFFPIQWRFIAWRRCPEHDCLLEDACPHCGKPVLLPACIQQSTAGRAGYATLDRCLSCSHRLTSAVPCHLEANGTRIVNAWEDEQLTNGRALLAALMNRSFRIEGRHMTYRLTSLRELDRQRAFPLRLDWLSPESLRKRQRSNGQIAVAALRELPSS